MSRTRKTGAAPRFVVDDEWLRRALKVDARAITRGDVLVEPEQAQTVYPRYVSRMKGAYLWDIDGNRYIDYMLGYGPVVLGHADDRVDAAVIAQMRLGNCMAPLWSPRQVELTELLCETLPGAEHAYLLKTGSDATSAAVRLARIYTRRPMVVRWGYNGWHDWACPRAEGIPDEVRSLTTTFTHGDADSLREVFARYPDQIACVLTMPFNEDVTSAAHLEELRAITDDHGALFILDELRSGFRMASGGAQEYFGVKADICAYGKAMANGYPISALAGRADVMLGLAQTRISSTFYAGPLEMAAAIETIAVLRESDALERIWLLGAALQAGLAEIIAESGVSAEVTGYPPMPFLRFTDPDVEARMKVRTRFYIEAVRAGVLLHPEHQWFLSAAHSEDDIGFTVNACRDAMYAAMTA